MRRLEVLQYHEDGHKSYVVYEVAPDGSEFVVAVVPTRGQAEAILDTR